MAVKIDRDQYEKAVELVVDGASGADLHRAGIKLKDGTVISERHGRRLKSQILEEYEVETEEEYPESGGKDQVVFDEEGDTATASAVTHSRIMTLDDLIEACDIDLEVWKIDRHVINKWEVGRKDKTVDLSWNKGAADGHVRDSGGIFVEPLIQVKAWLSKREERPYQEIVDNYIEQLKDYVPQYDLPEPACPQGNHMFVANFYDTHFGKRAAGEFVTLEESKKEFMDVVDRMVARMLADPREVNVVLLPVGHDLLHVDGLNETTTRGIKVQNAYDPRDAANVAIDVYKYAIEKFSAVAPDIIVSVVQGNHSRYSSHFVGKVLEAWFDNNDNVTIDTGKKPRKHFLYGVTYLCLLHGERMNTQRLAAALPVEAGYKYSEATYREVLTGHLHKARKMFMVLDEEAGLVVRVIPAMCETDEYHLLLSYIGTHRAAEGIYYHYERGPAGSFYIFV